VSRHVLITGAAGGLGSAIAERFAAAGDRITGVDAREAPLRARLNALAVAHGVAVTAIPADLSDPAAGVVVDRAWERAGPVDVLVNAAGIWPATPLLDMTAQMWDHVLAINTRAPMLATVALARRAVATGRPASVVNLASGAAIRARPGAAHYSTSKAALEMLTRSCAVELGAAGIRVNAVSPRSGPTWPLAEPTAGGRVRAWTDEPDEAGYLGVGFGGGEPTLYRRLPRCATTSATSMRNFTGLSTFARRAKAWKPRSGSAL
jgi:NAD(P)-dependent dehydrogenase (short-subunit alcohol dehydrogenase family)